MHGQAKIARGYTVRVRRDADAAESYHVYYTPRTLQYTRAHDGPPKQAPADFEAVARVDDLVIHWVNPPSDPEASQQEAEEPPAMEAAAD